MIMQETQDITALPARQRILLTAYKLFYQDGIRATGVDRVIAQASVTKATFYRHFPSKNDLITAFLDYRHLRWMEWFTETLEKYGNDLPALVPTLAEWFMDVDFRGCAFINSVGELGQGMPEVVAITQQHKQEMTAVIAGLLPHSRQRQVQAQAIALAIDGAIVNAQFLQNPENALKSLASLLAFFPTGSTRTQSKSKKSLSKSRK